MKFCLILSALIAAAAAQGLFGGLGSTLQGTIGKIPGGSQLLDTSKLPLPGTIKNFADYVAKTGKKYATEAETKLREGIFAEHKKTVDSHNELFKSGKSTFEMGLNFLSDLNPIEFLKGLTGRKKNAQGESKVKNRKAAAPPSVAAIPDSFDWREKGAVTPVKFQGLECGACWSFVVTGAIEGHAYRKTKVLHNLSEQHLVDCSNEYGNTGCDGGYHDYAFEYVVDNKGISKADAYPYLEKQETCKYKDTDKAATIEAFAVIPPGNETLMKEVVATLGPVAASLNAIDSLQLYKKGIYKDDACNGGEPTHMVLIVGYGSENGEDYWIIKNSWTDKWGENGYFRIPRNKNYCGIAQEGSYPIV